MRKDLPHLCDVIEEAYEFMLAYAAQGLAGDAARRSEPQLRAFLTRAAAALTDISEVLSALIEREPLDLAPQYRACGAVLGRDAGDTLAAIELVLAQPSISSQLVDNLNASIHLRALLADLFLIDEVSMRRLTRGGIRQPASIQSRTPEL